MALFPEEKNVLHMLLQEWYAGIEAATMEADGIFSEKGKMYDRKNPAWDRMTWPTGFQHEISKKSNRVAQMFDGFNPADPTKVNWDEVNEELGDILNYSRMLISLNEMMRARDFTLTMARMDEIKKLARAEVFVPTSIPCHSCEVLPGEWFVWFEGGGYVAMCNDCSSHAKRNGYEDYGGVVQMQLISDASKRETQ